MHTTRPSKLRLVSLAITVLAIGCSSQSPETSTMPGVPDDSTDATLDAAPPSVSSSATFEARCDVASLVASAWLFETNGMLPGESEQTDEKSDLGPGFVTTPMSFVANAVPDVIPYDDSKPSLTPVQPAGSLVEVVHLEAASGNPSDLRPLPSPEELAAHKGPFFVFVTYRGDGEPGIAGTAQRQGDGGIMFDGPCGEIRGTAFASIASALDAEPTLDFLLQWRTDIRAGNYQKYLAAAEVAAAEAARLAQETAWLSAAPSERTLRPGIPASVASRLDLRGLYLDVTDMAPGSQLIVRSPSGVSGGALPEALPVLYPAYFLAGDEKIEIVVKAADGHQEIVAAFDPTEIDPLGIVVVSGEVTRVRLEFVGPGEVSGRFAISDPKALRASLLEESG